MGTATDIRRKQHCDVGRRRRRAALWCGVSHSQAPLRSVGTRYRWVASTRAGWRSSRHRRVGTSPPAEPGAEDRRGSHSGFTCIVSRTSRRSDVDSVHASPASEMELPNLWSKCELWWRIEGFGCDVVFGPEVSRPSAETPSSVHWRRFDLQLTRVHSALALSGRCALQIYLLTYLLVNTHKFMKVSQRRNYWNHCKNNRKFVFYVQFNL